MPMSYLYNTEVVSILFKQLNDKVQEFESCFLLDVEENTEERCEFSILTNVNEKNMNAIINSFVEDFNYSLVLKDIKDVTITTYVCDRKERNKVMITYIKDIVEFLLNELNKNKEYLFDNICVKYF